MADTTVAPNNKLVSFSGRKRMPVVSKAQNRFMHWAKANPSASGVPKKVSTEFTAGQKPGALKGLPERAPKKLAHGGRLEAGERVIVGEKGPELFEAKRPGRVVPSKKVRMLRKGASISNRQYDKHFPGSDQQPIDAATR